MGNTIKLHRVLRAAPEKVYRAVLDPDALVKWSPPNGFTARVHHLVLVPTISEIEQGGYFQIELTC